MRRLVSINKQGLLTDELYRAPHVLLGDPFVKAMGAMASKVERPLFSYDPPVDFDGKPSSPAAQRLAEVETAVLDWAWVQEDPTNPDHSVMGCDLVYTRMLGSLLNSQVGHKTHELRKGGPKRPEKVVLFGAPELAGMQYEVKSLGVYAEAVPLYSRLVHSDADSKPDPDFHIYPGFIKDGAIPAEFFEDPES